MATTPLERHRLRRPREATGSPSQKGKSPDEGTGLLPIGRRGGEGERRHTNLRSCRIGHFVLECLESGSGRTEQLVLALASAAISMAVSAAITIAAAIAMAISAAITIAAAISMAISVAISMAVSAISMAIPVVIDFLDR